MSLYETLGITKNATKGEIKRAYRKKAKECHPDIGGEGFEEVNKAYAVLSDDHKRAQYDATGTINDKSPQDEALNELMNLINKYFDAHSTFDKDIIADIKEGVNRIIGDIEDTISKAKRVKNKFEKLKNRVKRKANKKGENNLFNALIQKKIEEIDKNIRITQLDIDKYKRVYDMLNEYEDCNKGSYERDTFIKLSDLFVSAINKTSW